jgi:pilus assembly protein CpaE
VRTEGIRHATANVVIVGLDEDEMGMVRECLSAEAVLPATSVAFVDALDQVFNAYPDVVLIGFEREPEEAERLARDLVKERLQAKIIAVARRDIGGAAKRAMRAGFSDFVVIPDESDQLRVAVKEAAFHAGDGEAKGTLLAVTGAKGGVGTSFLVTNIAAELAAIHRVLVIDLDFTMGDLAPMMDLMPRDSILDIVAKIDTLDERSLTGAAQVHASKVHFICQPNNIEQIGEIRPDDIVEILSTASRAYQYIILDCGHRNDEVTTTCLSVADQIFLVATPDVVSIRDCHRRMQALTSIGIERPRINVVLNRVPEMPYLSRQTIETNLDVQIMGQVSDDPARVNHAINEGKLVKDLYPKAEIVVELARLVGLLSDDPAEIAAAAAAAAKAPEKKGFFQRFFNR